MRVSDMSFGKKLIIVLLYISLAICAIIIGMIVYEGLTHYYGGSDIETIHDPVADEWNVIYDCRSDWVVIGTSDTESGAEVLADELSERNDLDRFCDIRNTAEVKP